jgi:hypothetical protein
MRFDEVELEAAPLIEPLIEPAVESSASVDAPAVRQTWWRRLLSLITDLSLFAALVLALSPLLPQPYQWKHVASLAGFVLVVSYYYFVGTWMLWGKTIGGAIFDVRRPAMTLRDASMRWAIGLLLTGVCGLAAYVATVFR